MKIFKNKFLVKLIATICLFLTLLNFCGTNKVYAKDAGWGGVLISPIVHLMTALGDAIMDILHKALMEQETSVIKIDGNDFWTNFWGIFWIVVLSIVAATLVVVGASFLAGLAPAVSGVIAGAGWSFSMGSVTLGTLLGAAAAGICTGVVLNASWFPEDIYLPAYSLSAEEIFANTLPLFDVNFFEPMEDIPVDAGLGKVPLANPRIAAYLITTEAEYESYVQGTLQPFFARDISQDEKKLWTEGEIGRFFQSNTLNDTRDKYEKLDKKLSESDTDADKALYYTLSCVKGGLPSNVDIKYKIWSGDEVWYKTYSKVDLSATHNQIRIFFSKDNSEAIHIVLEDEGDTTLVPITTYLFSTAGQLREIISTWYYILRNIALLVLMLLLIYTGIRIVIGSTAGEKAKYKERLIDWLVAMCLVMTMHYVMVFAVNVVEEITVLVRNTKNTNVAYIRLSQEQWNNVQKLNLQESEACEFVDDAGAESGQALVWQTDLVGMFRIQAQLENEGSAKWVGYSLCFVVLVLFTLFFALTYLKRVVYMAFLTMIAPLVAMTYPIDKMTDGQAQAFNSWLKEYIFNLMIQPLHLLLYTILVVSAFDLASKNAIYALVAVGFIIPAEKLMRKFFGFEKATTPGLLGGAAGAALAMTGLQNLLKPKSHGKGEGGHTGKEQAQGQNKVKISGANKTDAMDAMVAGGLPDTKKQHNPKLSRDQIDEMIAEGIEPGDPEYSHYLSNFGINPNENTLNVPQGTNTNPSSQAPSKSNVKVPKAHKRHILRAVGRASLGAGRKLAVGALTGIHPLKMAGKIATGAVGATAGLLIGTASGDVGKAFQYTTAGGLAGAKLAGSLLEGKNLLTDDYKEDVKQSYYGADYAKVYQEKMRKKQVKQLKSAENINYLMRNMSVDRAQANNILETTGERCVTDEGITDLDDIVTIHKLTEANAMSFEKAVAARNYAKTRLGGSGTKSITGDKRRKYLDTWAKEYKDKYNLTDYEAQAWAEQSMNAAIRFNDTKDSLK